MGHDAELFAGGERIAYWRSSRAIHATLAALSEVGLYGATAEVAKVLDGCGACEYLISGGPGVMMEVLEAAGQAMRVLEGLSVEDIEHVVGPAQVSARLSGAEKFTYKATW